MMERDSSRRLLGMIRKTCRTSTAERQMERLMAAGVDRYSVVETIIGPNGSVTDTVEQGHVVAISSLAVLGPLREARKIAELIRGRGADLVALDEGLDTREDGAWSGLEALARYEHLRRSYETTFALRRQSARTTVKPGRPRKLREEHRAYARDLASAGDAPVVIVAALVERFGEDARVSESTVRRLLKDGQGR